MQKTLRVLFLLIFLLSLGNLPAHAQAQAQPSSLAYIPLISPQGDTSVPVVFRARQAFEALAPKLLEAQAKGQIVRFEPEFNFGLLKVEYQSGFDLAAALAVESGATPLVFDNAQSVVNYTQMSQSLRRSATGISSPDPWIDTVLYDSCFDAGNMGAGNYFKAYLFDASTRLVARTDGYANPGGSLQGCFDFGIYTGLVPGYLFIFNLFNPAGTTLLNSYSTVVAHLDITSISTKTTTFKGTGPASSPLSAWLVHANLDATESYTQSEKDLTSTSKGAWSVNFAPAAMRGGDDIEITWIDPASIFSFTRDLTAPYIYCREGGYYCESYGIPGNSAKISVVHAKKTYKSSGKFSNQGYFGSDVYDAHADPVYLAAGDKVTGTGAPSLTLPNLTANVDYDTDMVTGVAPANCYFEAGLEVYDYLLDSWSWHRIWLESDGTGRYYADYSGTLDIQLSQRLFPVVNYTDPITGNETGYVGYLDP